MLNWKTFPHHLPQHGELCWLSRVPAKTSQMLAVWDESNADFQLAGDSLRLPWYLVRLWASAPSGAQARTLPEITNPYKWRRFPDYRPQDGDRVWHHLYDLAAGPIRGLYRVVDGTPWFGDEATGSLCPWQLVVVWRPYGSVAV